MQWEKKKGDMLVRVPQENTSANTFKTELSLSHEFYSLLGPMAIFVTKL